MQRATRSSGGFRVRHPAIRTRSRQACGLLGVIVFGASASACRPDSTTIDRFASFTFAGGPAECRLNGGSFELCTSPTFFARFSTTMAERAAPDSVPLALKRPLV